MLRRLAVLALALLAGACSGSSGGTTGATILVGGDRVEVASLIDGNAALCEAVTHLDKARALFFDRSHDALHTVARALEDVDSALAGALLVAKEKVESELTTPPPARRVDLLALAEVYRTGLARLAITAPACEK